MGNVDVFKIYESTEVLQLILKWRKFHTHTHTGKTSVTCVRIMRRKKKQQRKYARKAIGQFILLTVGAKQSTVFCLLTQPLSSPPPLSSFVVQQHEPKTIEHSSLSCEKWIKLSASWARNHYPFQSNFADPRFIGEGKQWRDYWLKFLHAVIANENWNTQKTQYRKVLFFFRLLL